MNRLASTLAVPALSLALLSGCTTPYPNGTPIAGATIDANPVARGSAEFCEIYARQTAGNVYDTNRDADSGSGYNAFEAQRARQAGRQAYQRCLSGRTG